jgi:hypothetical protein
MALRRWVAVLVVFPGVVLLTFGTVLAATPTFGTKTIPTGARAWSLAVGDLNQDHVADLVLADNDPKGIDVLLGKGDGSFGKVTRFSSGEPAPTGIALADLNGDGHLDAVIANKENDSISVRLGTGNGSFGDIKSYDVGGDARIVTGDFNHDGHPDVVIADQNGTGDEVTVLLGTGKGDFLPPMHDVIASTDLPTSVTTADMNGDGNADILYGGGSQQTAGGEIFLLTGDGTGSFTPASTTAVEANPSSIAVADFNKDGRQDFAVTNEYPSDVQLFAAEGALHYTTTGTIHIKKYAECVVAADINGDGDADLAVTDAASIDGPPYDDGVSILDGKGDGTFDTAERYPTGIDPHVVRVADLNNDGKLDVVTADFESSIATVLLNGVQTEGASTAPPSTSSLPKPSVEPLRASTSHQTASPAPTPTALAIRQGSAFASSASSAAHHSRIPLFIGGAAIAVGGAALVGWRFVLLR